jgi:hypothetical protein
MVDAISARLRRAPDVELVKDAGSEPCWRQGPIRGHRSNEGSRRSNERGDIASTI